MHRGFEHEEENDKGKEQCSAHEEEKDKGEEKCSAHWAELVSVGELVAVGVEPGVDAPLVGLLHVVQQEG